MPNALHSVPQSPSLAPAPCAPITVTCARGGTITIPQAEAPDFLRSTIETIADLLLSACEKDRATGLSTPESALHANAFALASEALEAITQLHPK